MVDVVVVVVVKMPDTMEEMRLLIPNSGLATRTLSDGLSNDGRMKDDSFTSLTLGLWVLRNCGNNVGSKL